MAETRAIEQHLVPFPPGEIRKSNRRRDAFEGEKPIAVDAREADKDLPQRLAAHALHRVAPEAFDLTDDTHLCLRFTCSGINFCDAWAKAHANR
jgi:hypothetical protein